MSWEIVIGLETHAQLSTESKMFSGSPTAFGAAPNTQASAVDIALPGVLPVANKGAVERAIRFGLAVGGTINRRSVFARKNYFYPDLPKGYQISQYELPIVQGGTVSIITKAGEKTIRLTRAHLEEDAGKSLHEFARDGTFLRGGTAPFDRGTEIDWSHVSAIDLNRAGTPLLEIVSEPEMRSAEEAVAYARTLHSLVRWIGICDGNMQEGSFRCDANVSVRRPGAPLGTRCEIKNLNSFRFIELAIEFEVKRQIEILEDGGKIVQETRLYDSEKNETRSMRSKEDAHDYRYFPDPDLLPLVVSERWIEEIRANMSELPPVILRRYVEEFGLTPYLASQLTDSYEKHLFFEGASVRNSDTVLPISTMTDHAFIRRIAVWVSGEVSRKLNDDGGHAWEFWIAPETLGRIALREHDGTISSITARDLFNEFWDEDHKHGSCRPPEEVDLAIKQRGLRQLSDTGALEKIVDDVLVANPKSVEEFKAGKDKAFNSLVGQVMKATQGKANPVQVNEILKRKLSR